MTPILVVYALGLWAAKWWPIWLALAALGIHHIATRKATK